MTQNNSNSNYSGFTNFSFKDRYAKKPDVGETKRFRFVGNPFKYKVHKDFKNKITKICTKTLSIRSEPTIDANGRFVKGEYIYYQTDAMGNKIPYNADDYVCSCCSRDMTIANGWAINVIDIDEEAEAIQSGEIPHLKVMEFTKLVNEQLKEYHERTGVFPQDVNQAPVFSMTGYYLETGLKPEPKDKRFKMVAGDSPWALPENWVQAYFHGVNGAAPMLHDLPEIYHPLKQGEHLNAWVKPTAQAASVVPAAQVAQPAPAQPRFITGEAAVPTPMPAPAAVPTPAPVAAAAPLPTPAPAASTPMPPSPAPQSAVPQPAPQPAPAAPSNAVVNPVPAPAAGSAPLTSGTPSEDEINDQLSKLGL